LATAVHTENIVTGQTMADIDRETIQVRGIPSSTLMERAGWQVADETHRRCGNPRRPVLILCGKGNNGGDGWVAARHLHHRGYRPAVLATHPPETFSKDTALNWERYRALPASRWEVFEEPRSLSLFQDRPVVLDALLGTGAKGAPQAPYDRLIDLANDHADWILGVDIASGVDAETGQVESVAIRCKATLAIGLPKQGQVLRQGLDRTGDLILADIGFPRDLTEGALHEAELLTPEWAAAHFPARSASTHKGDRGKILLVAGSPQLMGAGFLAAEAALAAGAGLVTLALPASLNSAAKIRVPEAMTLPLPENSDGSLSRTGLEALLAIMEKMDACGIGPGLGSNPETAELVRSLVSQTQLPVVLDADAIKAFADPSAKELLRNRRGEVVLTPHPGELAHLLDKSSPAEIESDRWANARAAVEDLGKVLLLKGPATVIAAPGQVHWISRAGHPAMAQGGMGDTLTGMIAALLGWGLPARGAAALGAFWHGRSGECAAGLFGPHSVTATQLISQLGRAFREMCPDAHHGRQQAAPHFHYCVQKRMKPKWMD
jgi:NAD(P)H-hydrate epimerase